MATNADEPEETNEVSEESKVDTVDDAELRQALQSADKPTEEEAEEVKTESESEEKSEDTTLKNEVPEHDLAWYQKAYPESTKEALRLKKENDELKAAQTPPPPVEAPAPTDEVLTPEQLYFRGKIKEETDQAFNEITDKYPQVKDPETYKRFVAEAQIVGKVITDSEKRLPSPKELYEKTAVILGLTADNSEVTSALKDVASSTRTSSGPASPAPQSKVTEAMIAENQKWYPNKSREDIIKELEPYVK